MRSRFDRFIILFAAAYELGYLVGWLTKVIERGPP